VLGQFKANGPTSLSLPHRRSINCVTIGSNVIGLNRDYVAAAQLAIDGKIEHC
jgi:hypothetical protein